MTTVFKVEFVKNALLKGLDYLISTNLNVEKDRQQTTNRIVCREFSET